MKSIELNKIYTVQEYFLLEESGEIRHEFINGNLIEMSGPSREHHKICKNLLRLLENLLKDKGYEVYIENMKVKIENENQYYYPDIFITKEPKTQENRYVQFQPELIIEVLSETTRTKDLIDKFIQYRKISTLKYYLVVEAQKCLILCNSKENGEWNMFSYTQLNEIINLTLFNIELPVEKIYKS
ncbi:MAG: Uma2 family endonuclease [Bacteroidota bacterium]|nr:Uma2 family endonuclease [Bacteroidota bacterium]